MAYERQLAYIPGGMKGVYVKLFIRILQLLLGITMLGIYVADILTARSSKPASSNTKGTKAKTPTTPIAVSPEWVFAAFVGALSALTSLFYLIPCFAAYLFFWLDALLVLLHAVVIGIFAKLYLSKTISSSDKATIKAHGPDRHREAMAAVVDAVSGLLWLSSALFSTIIYLRVRRMKKASGGSA